MKTFKSLLAEMDQPKSPEEKRFKDQHSVEVLDPEGHGDDIKPRTKKKKRLADYMDGADKAAYDQAYTVKKEGFDENDLADAILEAHGEAILEMSDEELDSIIDEAYDKLEG